MKFSNSYIAVAFFFISLVGCAKPGSSEYFKYTVQGTYNNKPISYSQYYKCSQFVQPTEGPDAPLHLRWESEGLDRAAIQLDMSHTLILRGDQSFCLDRAARELNQPIAMLEASDNLIKLYIVRGNAKNSLLSIDRVKIEPTNESTDHLGPTESQVALANAILAKYKNRFENVQATYIPYYVWATTGNSQNYFKSLTEVVVAKVDEAPPVSGRSDMFVRFPFYRDRAYRLIDGKVSDLIHKELVYADHFFELVNTPQDDGTVFYSSKEMDRSVDAIVNYKGTIVSVKTMQEAYDPETKNIISFMHQSAPDLAGVLNVFAR
ncbi:hypothetical protein [Solimicrobium silvestre]|uniref:Lipoprotein n=1 Tax=Solimicrobium silvestre TaxID=2099400 RepID=A0A2S9GVS4_9BURK|nr:hypothetical protein [Solimicrobium silvestre]PRC91814.1 hypothetical protein S2091_3569 [Solimicrobium silvestre]